MPYICPQRLSPKVRPSPQRSACDSRQILPRIAACMEKRLGESSSFSIPSLKLTWKPIKTSISKASRLHGAFLRFHVSFGEVKLAGCKELSCSSWRGPAPSSLHLPYHSLQTPDLTPSIREHIRSLYPCARQSGIPSCLRASSESRFETSIPLNQKRGLGLVEG